MGRLYLCTYLSSFYASDHLSFFQSLVFLNCQMKRTGTGRTGRSCIVLCSDEFCPRCKCKGEVGSLLTVQLAELKPKKSENPRSWIVTGQHLGKSLSSFANMQYLKLAISECLPKNKKKILVLLRQIGGSGVLISLSANTFQVSD